MRRTLPHRTWHPKPPVWGAVQAATLSLALVCLLGLGLGACAIEDPYARRYDPYLKVASEHREPLRHAWNSVRAKRYAEARRQAEAIVAQDPGLSMAQVLLGLALVGLGKQDEAAQAYGAAIRADPGNPLARFNLGTLYGAQGRPRDAAGQFREATRLDPEYRLAWLNLAIAQADAGRFRRARRALKRYEAREPGTAAAANLRGTILLDEGMPAEAIAELKAAVAKAPTGAAYHLNLARAYEAAERGSEAIGAYERYLELAPRADEDRKAVLDRLRQLRKK